MEKEKFIKFLAEGYIKNFFYKKNEAWIKSFFIAKLKNNKFDIDELKFKTERELYWFQDISFGLLEIYLLQCKIKELQEEPLINNEKEIGMQLNLLKYIVELSEKRMDDILKNQREYYTISQLMKKSWENILVDLGSDKKKEHINLKNDRELDLNDREQQEYLKEVKKIFRLVFDTRNEKYKHEIPSFYNIFFMINPLLLRFFIDDIKNNKKCFTKNINFANELKDIIEVTAKYQERNKKIERIADSLCESGDKEEVN